MRKPIKNPLLRYVWGMDPVISGLCYKGTLLLRSYWEMTIYGHFPIIPL